MKLPALWQQAAPRFTKKMGLKPHPSFDGFGARIISSTVQ
ncbi:hypothetical protein SAMD00079811_67120 [Scytonema sp. HK-05]|nr:hypothetical protein SAMD00079811_67120 [Scytonema sp. HK-05]